MNATTASKLPRRKLGLERLEDRQLLATVLSESFKTLQFEGTGNFTAQARGDIVNTNDYHDDAAGGMTLSGSVIYHSNVAGGGFASVTGSGTGAENCPPDFGLIDDYDFSFDATAGITHDDTLSLAINTTRYDYGDHPCLGDWVAGDTPFDTTFVGDVDISSIPYTAVLTMSETGTFPTEIGPRPYRSEGTINVALTPQAKDFNGDDIPFNLRVYEPYAHNGFVDFYFDVDGATLAAATPETVLASVELYFATGPNASDIIGAPLGNHPIHWNTYSASLRVELPASIPGGATHLVVIGDGLNALTEGDETDNVRSVEFTPPGRIVFYTFTAEITEVQPNDSAPEQAPTVSVGETITGSFSYDIDTGLYGTAFVPLAGMPLGELEYFATYWQQVEDTSAYDFVIFSEAYIEEWSEFPFVFTDFYFSDESIVNQVLPASLIGLDGEVRFGSEAYDGSEMGFFVRAQITTLTPFLTLDGIDEEITIDEETAGQIDIAGLFAEVNVEIDESSITITLQPEHGILAVDDVTGQVTYRPNPNFAGTDSFRYFVFDVQGNQSGEAIVVITVTEVLEPYMNPAGNLFVDILDLETTALDAILIINALNALGSRDLEPPAPGVVITVFYDVNGDNILSPLDAVLVINAINSGRSSQGEATTTTLIESPPVATVASTPNEVSDAVFANVASEAEEQEQESEPWWAMIAGPAVGNVLKTMPAYLPLAWQSPVEDSQLFSVRASRRAFDLALRADRDWWREWAV